MTASGLVSATETGGPYLEERKSPCKCGCKETKSLDSKAPASPQFKRELEDDVRMLLERAKEVKASGRKRYCEYLQS